VVPKRLGDRGTPIEASAVSGWRVAGEVERQAREHDIVLIDSPPMPKPKRGSRSAPANSSSCRYSLRRSISGRPSRRSTRAEKTPALLVLNRVPPRAKLTGTVLEAFNALDVPIATAQIGNRVALAAAINEGRGILEYERSGAAAREIKALVEEVLERCAT
jgi:chromosome partitioning protein